MTNAIYQGGVLVIDEAEVKAAISHSNKQVVQNPSLERASRLDQNCPWSFASNFKPLPSKTTAESSSIRQARRIHDTEAPTENKEQGLENAEPNPANLGPTDRACLILGEPKGCRISSTWSCLGFIYGAGKINILPKSKICATNGESVRYHLKLIAKTW